MNLDALRGCRGCSSEGLSNGITERGERIEVALLLQINSTIEVGENVKKFFAILGGALIGISSLAAPANAQQPPAFSSIESMVLPDIAYVVFPWLAQPGSPAPAPAVTPVLRNCSPQATPEVHPGYIILYCGDAHSTLGDITWNSWGLDGASGRARLGEKTCVPDCARGGFTYRYVNFHLGGARVAWR